MIAINVVRGQSKKYMNKVKKDGRVNNGGKRVGAGRKTTLYGEETVNMSFRAPISKRAYMRKFVNEKLKEFKIKK